MKSSLFVCDQSRPFTKGKFSIVMPCYNAKKTITQSILSVLNQTYTNFELIIVNDGSTDETKALVQIGRAHV